MAMTKTVAPTPCPERGLTGCKGPAEQELYHRFRAALPNAAPAACKKSRAAPVTASQSGSACAATRVEPWISFYSPLTISVVGGFLLKIEN